MTKKIFLMALGISMVILSGCGSGSDSSTSDTDSQTTLSDSDTQITSNEQLIAELELSGEIPTLDRSSDIKGPDTDNNGIRDDIETYIESMPITVEQEKAVRQLARAMQSSLLVDIKDDAALTNQIVKASRSIQCLSVRVDNILLNKNILTSIESKTANTKERTMKYIQFNNALSGSTITLQRGDTCDE